MPNKISGSPECRNQKTIATVTKKTYGHNSKGYLSDPFYIQHFQYVTVDGTGPARARGHSESIRLEYGFCEEKIAGGQGTSDVGRGGHKLPDIT